MSLWLFIGRLNPPHNWHIKIIEKSLKEDEKTLVLLWSPLKKDENNPLDFKERRDLLLKYFKNNENLKILEIEDSSSDLIWSLHVYKRIWDNFYNFLELNFYAWDFWNDSAYKVIKKYKWYFFRIKINFIEISRKNSFINHNSQEIKLSSTNFRKALKDKNYSLAEKFTDKKIFEEIKKLAF